MTFSPELWGACQAAHIAPFVVPYTQGKCLDIGSGPGKVWPGVIGVDKATDKGRPITDMALDGTDLSTFADASLDGIFSSFLLHQIEPSKVNAVLEEWARVLKVGGYLTLYLPNLLVPLNDSAKDALQKWDVNQADVVERLQTTSCGWEMVENEERFEGEEFGLLIVVRKLADKVWREKAWQRNPDGKKRALVIRYGAIGDVIMAAAVFPLLKAQGYHTTLLCHLKTEPVIRHDPNIDEILTQTEDFVPNEMLGPYWSILGRRYDRVVNLCESIEGLLLALPGRLNHSYSDEARRRIYDPINYHEHTHNIAAVPFDFRGARFHPTEAEDRWAQAVRRRMSGPLVIWCINGSATHKVYPWVQTVSAWLLERTPCHIMLYADAGVGKQLQDAIMGCLAKDGCDMDRVHGSAGKWDIRKSLTFARLADCVVGPETGPMNAVSMESVPKVIYLSHSSADNLTRHWVNTTTLTPERDQAPCYPCHRLHYTWEHCFKSEKTEAALCASSIAPEVVFKAVAEHLVARVAA